VLLRLTAWLTGLLLIASAATFVLATWQVRQIYEPSLDKVSKSLQDTLGFFCEQQTLLAQDPWFHEPRPEGDAGELLNGWVHWTARWSVPEGSPLTIPPHLPQLNDGFKYWLGWTADVSTLDFGWMRRLHAYDRWDVLEGNPVRPEDTADWLGGYFSSPLQLWAKFRLRHGLKTGQPLEAARDVRQLAWLVYRTDTVLGGMLATALLGLERDAHDSMKAPPPEWRPMSHEQLARMRAILGTGYLFSSLLAPPEVGKQARRCGEPAVSRCGALSEAAQVMKYVQPLTGRRHRKRYAALTEDLEALSCPTSLPRGIWERGRTYRESERREPLPWEGEELRQLLPEQQPVVTHFYLRAPGEWVTRLRIGTLSELLNYSVPGDLRLLEDFRARLQSGDFGPRTEAP
jgi:hypothetical protein